METPSMDKLTFTGVIVREGIARQGEASSSLCPELDVASSCPGCR